MKKVRNNVYTYILLQISFFIYALSSFFSKLSTYNNVEIKNVIICYMLSVFCLGINAIIWQQILKKMNLSIAYSNKGVTIIWGLIFGIIFFNEEISFGKITGIFIVILGIFILMRKDENKEKSNV